MQLDSEYFLEMRSVCKEFPGVRALDKVDFNLCKGEVHVLVGENGAGKSTLIKILSGAYAMDAGEVNIDGQPVVITKPSDAAALGIFTIYQEIMLVPPLSVAENVYLGELKSNAGIVDWNEIRSNSRAILDRLGGQHIHVNARLKDLSIAQQQLVAIARALRRKTRVLVMDEPTASLTPAEIDHLFEIIRSLKAEGVSIIYISHRLEEIKQIGDRITVMRDGHVVGTISVKDASREIIIRMMVGRDVLVEPRKSRAHPGEPVLRVEHFSSPGRLHDISFEIKRGEVVGLAGLIGAGRTELARAIFGADVGASGAVYLDGKLTTIRTPYDAISTGIALVPEDRKVQGIISVLNVQVNLMLAYGNRYYRGLLDFTQDRAVTNRFIQQLSIRTPSVSKRIAELSGGNQQKVVLARWLCMKMKVLILDEVTRGIDVGAKAEIYQLIDEMAEAGYGILMISSELPEVLTLSDRILVMHEGRLTGEFDRAEATQEKIMLKAIGAEN